MNTSRSLHDPSQLAYAALLPIFCSVYYSQEMSADYSIGDRVEVRWQAKPFAANVVHVHTPGKVDVVYDIDGSVGIFLTPGEHGLKLLGDEEKVRAVPI